MSIDKLAAAIEALPEDEENHRTDVWYRTQKEHWLGWLASYQGPGAYGRAQFNRDAQFAYNHIVNPYMLLWLVEAAGVDRSLVKSAHEASEIGTTLMQKAGAVRKAVPWGVVARCLWPGDLAAQH